MSDTRRRRVKHKTRADRNNLTPAAILIRITRARRVEGGLQLRIGVFVVARGRLGQRW